MPSAHRGLKSRSPPGFDGSRGEAAPVALRSRGRGGALASVPYPQAPQGMDGRRECCSERGHKVAATSSRQGPHLQDVAPEVLLEDFGDQRHGAPAAWGCGQERGRGQGRSTSLPAIPSAGPCRGGEGGATRRMTEWTEGGSCAAPAWDAHIRVPGSSSLLVHRRASR